jgi:hypothetical protein
MKSSTMITEVFVNNSVKEVATFPLSFYEENMPDDASKIRQAALQGKTSFTRPHSDGVIETGVLTFSWKNPRPANRKGNSIFDRYTVATIREFAEKYNFRKRAGNLTSWQHCAACAAVGTLCTVKEWNGPEGVAYFDDALAIAARLDSNLIDIDQLEIRELHPEE